MQETIHPDLDENIKEFFKSETETALIEKMDNRLNTLQKQRHKLRQRIMVKPNDVCPCGSLKKFKKCCMNKVL